MNANAPVIAQLNDQARQSLTNVYITQGLLAEAGEELPAILQAIRTFNDFTKNNDPWEEHDFGTIHYKGLKIFWKMDTYSDKTMRFGAEDPLSPEAVRVLTIMLASEY